MPTAATPDDSPTRGKAAGFWIAALALACGAIFSLGLCLQVPDEVFYNGDGGVKLLLAKQFLAGHWGPDIRPPDDPLVRQLWRAGFLPLAAPFVYDIDGRYVQCFPVFFSAITAPWYKLLGFQGLYVVPLASLWVVWLRFWWLCRQLSLGSAASAMGLILLLLATPLTLYGATYWEHTLTVALAFGGLAEMVLHLKRRRPVWTLVAAGVLLGLAGWLRPENICFALAAVAAWWCPCRRAGDVASWLTLCLATAITLGLFLVFNQTVYGHPLGAHSFSVIKTKTFGDHLLSESLPLLWQLNVLQLWYLPAILLAVPGGLLIWIRRRPRAALAGFLLLTILLYSASVPVIINHLGGLQWGPRYLLSSVPLVCLLAVLTLSAPSGDGGRPAKPSAWAVACLGVLIVAGLFVNSIYGTLTLWVNYHGRVLPALQVVRQRDERFIVVNHQFVAQELASAWDRHIFLRAESTPAFVNLAEALWRHGHREFLIVLQRSPGQPPEQLRQQGDGFSIEGRLLGLYGDYSIYTAEVVD